MMNESFLSNLHNRKTQLGTFIKLNSPEMIEMIGLAGFDFIVIDLEHSSLSISAAEQIIRTAELHCLKTIIRTSGKESHHILKALDIGATGIQVPQIYSEKEIHEIIQHAYYPPIGNRGVSFTQRAANYSFSSGREYMDDANEKTVVGIQIETVEALENLERFLQMDHIDLFFIGPVDLSISLNQSSDFLHGEFSKTIKETVKKILRHKKIPGIMVNSKSEYEFARNNHIPYIVWGSDITFMKKSLVSTISELKGT